jgi:hypothetical protein
MKNLLLASAASLLSVLSVLALPVEAQRVLGEFTLEAENGTFLGCVTCGDWHVYSIWNPNGLYGSVNGAFSVWNPNGLYGRMNSPYSMCSRASYNPFYVVDDRGRVVDELHISDGAYTEPGLDLLDSICSIQQRFSNP